MKWLLLAPIRFYQRHISPGLPRRCRYYPSCSAYAVSSIEVHGVGKGTLLAIWRILRCNPWTKGGVDLVPEKGDWPSKPLGHAELLDQWDNEEHASDLPGRTRNETRRTRGE